MAKPMPPARRPVIRPSEDFECLCLAEWLRSEGYKFTHIPNNTWTPSVAQKMLNKRRGVSPGVPDYMIVLKAGVLMFIEMKRVKGGRTAPEQEEWLDTLRRTGAYAMVCLGADAAVTAIQEAEREISRDL